MKKKIPMVAGAIITAVILLVYVAAPDLFKQMVPDGGTILGNGSVLGSGTEAGKNAYVSKGPIKATGTEGVAPGGFVYAKVTRIVDGDTLEAEIANGEYGNEEYKVRLLCIDTPETVKSGVDEQPYGKLATEKLTEMVLDKEVVLIFEKDIDDRYDRLLAYVMLEEGTCVNAALVEQGYARADIVRPNNIHKDYFYELQDKAIKEKKGLWSLPSKRRPFIKNDKGYYVPRYIENDAA